MKKIAILGCNEPQIPLIKKAKQMGLSTVVLSQNDTKLTDGIDKFYKVDFQNYDKLTEILSLEKINGICSIVSEQAVIPIAIICKKLNLSGITPRSAHICTNKILLKRAFSLSSMLTPKYLIADIDEPVSEIDQKCQKIHYPVVLKPKNLCSSQGILFIKDTDDLIKKYTYLKKYVSSDYLIEKYIDGESFGLEVFVNDGNVIFILPVGNISLSCEMIDIPIGHYTPYHEIKKSYYDTINRLIENFIKICDIRNSFLTIDCRIKENKIYFLEVGLRCGGVLLPQLMSNYYGINVYEYIINQCLGNNNINFILNNNTSNIAAGFLVSPNYKNINSNFITNADILEAKLYKRKVIIDTYIGNFYKLGHIVLKSNDSIPAKDKLSELTQKILH